MRCEVSCVASPDCSQLRGAWSGRSSLGPVGAGGLLFSPQPPGRSETDGAKPDGSRVCRFMVMEASAGWYKVGYQNSRQKLRGREGLNGLRFYHIKIGCTVKRQ